jgi:urease accessory protein
VTEGNALGVLQEARPLADPPAVPLAGSGRIVFGASRGKTTALSVRAESPLKLLTPKNHGLGAWAYVASFGGGLVDGDAIRLDVEVRAGATALVGTQSSTKVYRGSSGQRLLAHVGDGALLVAVPDAVSCFEGAGYEQHAEVRLEEGASLIYTDGFTCGRSARGERWLFARYLSRTTVVGPGGPPLLADAILLDPAHGPLSARMGRFDAFATVVALGPRAQPIAESILALPFEPRARADSVHSASKLTGGAILRVAAISAERVNHAVRRALGPLASLLGDDPFARKW